MDKEQYQTHLKPLELELVHLQEWIVAQGLKVVVLFEGRDAAGKGGAIKTLTRRLNPRVARIVALGKPSDRERTQWYFQRYVEHLPAAGEMVLFDRSWYNRAGVESVMGFCTEQEYQTFLGDCPQFEEMLMNAGIILLKYWFSVSDEEQERRFNARLQDPLKRWKFSEMDLASRSKWAEYSQAKDQMFEATDTDTSPWHVVDAEHKYAARLNFIAHLLSQIPYQPASYPEVVLPEIANKETQRPPVHAQRWIPKLYR